MKQNDVEFSVSPDVIAAGHYWVKLKDDPHKWRIAEVTYTDVHIRNNMSIEVTGRGSIGDVKEHEIAEWGPCVTPPPYLDEPEANMSGGWDDEGERRSRSIMRSGSEP